MSSLMLGLNRIKSEWSLTTLALAVFSPFVTQELFMGGNAMYYDLNTLSDNMIMLDRKQARYPNGVGECYHLRPEDEYSALMRRLGDQVTNLSLSSTDLFNPLDININYSEVESLLRLKSDFVLSFCEIIIGNKTGLEAIEKTVIDWVVQKIYHSCFADIRPENMPILSNMMETLKPGTSLRLNGWLRHQIGILAVL